MCRYMNKDVCNFKTIKTEGAIFSLINPVIQNDQLYGVYMKHAPFRNLTVYSYYYSLEQRVCQVN
jgi:hypothetical protein